MTSVLAQHGINVVDMINKSRGNVAYNLIDVADKPDQALISELCAIESVMNVREFRI
jgi:D-3-phosphoglycerate dehydrogenase